MARASVRSSVCGPPSSSSLPASNVVVVAAHLKGRLSLHAAKGGGLVYKTVVETFPLAPGEGSAPGRGRWWPSPWTCPGGECSSSSTRLALNQLLSSLLRHHQPKPLHGTHASATQFYASVLCVRASCCCTLNQTAHTDGISGRMSMGTF